MEEDEDYLIELLLANLVTDSRKKKTSSNYISDIFEFYVRSKYHYPKWLIEQLEKGLSMRNFRKLGIEDKKLAA